MAMDSDPTQTLKSSASKLPIKRRTPPHSFTSSTPDSPTAVHDGCHGDDPNPPPFKYHRIWTESDEIRFLQGLLDCTAENLSFPRDINVFYARFSSTMSQPYTKTQLSEKLRRLRRKFRVISARLTKGRDVSQLSPHDRNLYDISKQLWHPDFASSSPFRNNSVDKTKKSNLGSDHTVIEDAIKVANDGIELADFGLEGDLKLKQVNVELDCDVGKAIANMVVDVFDKCLKELRNGIDGEILSLDDCFKQGSVESFEERWRKQRVAELDVFSKRMRLVIEHSNHMQ
ncbi:unnamed protein product [Cuscuta epithymum]|uniref:Glabrous enhancer-binding protein-like DBD domain-containing protein n=1 Tax=Cuscuta epithymum TaxID=186058 RepID=A0AAV0FTK9_9ASTE|nr:unnamed protein product [Cuscuta epithymum]CAH9139004.1 unnamed protein product [Cuscuta epithymum]